jgi:hypothetical protein
MKLTKSELLDLLAYADGEASRDKTAEMEGLLARSAEARDLLAQQMALRQWIRDAEHERAAGADGIADVVMAKIARSVAAPGATRELARIETGVVQRRRVPWVGALAAVAALVALWASWSHRSSDRRAPVAVQGATPLAPPSSAIAAPSAQAGEEAAIATAETPEGPGIDVQAVESPEHEFSIFYVPGATGANAHASSVVVWIGEE